MRRLALCLVLLAVAVPLAASAASPAAGELAAIRARIRRLEQRLQELHGRLLDAAQRRDRIRTELELARARVAELELMLARSRDEIVRLKEETEALGRELEARRGMLAASLQMAALLGRPGPLQLFVDSVRGGDLERTLDSVSVLTAGQVKLMHEYEELRIRRRRRLAELSRAMENARTEAESLARRRRELEGLERQAEGDLARLERQERRTRRTLEDLNERAEALERLMARLESRTRMPPDEDVRRYRGALPWPAEGRIVERFGRHRLRRYATYTLCNGIRLDVPAGSEVRTVFPGEVAFARHFKGYGNTVVIDHGHGVYSVTAGLATILVRVGRQVQLGTAVGRVGSSKAGGNLYFEIRAGGRAVDPLRWLRLEEGAGRP